MRVLLTTDTVGGVWTFTQELTEHLLAGRHSVALASFGRMPSASQLEWTARQSVRFGTSFRFEPCESPLEWMQDNGTAFAEGADLLLDLAREFRADILHSNQFCWGALPLDIPKLITAHSDVMSWAQAANPSVLHGSTWLARYCSLVQQGLDRADAIVAPTSWMRQALRAHFHVAAPFDVISNGRSVPANDMPLHRKLQAITVGRLWDEAKGLSTLFDIQSPLPILIAGEERFEDSVAQIVPANITTLGFLDQQQVFTAMRESSIYIATSIYEPFGLAPLEAAMCGCAIVGRDLASFREVWGDAAAYFRDAGQLEQMLLQLSEDPYELAESQRAARERATRYTTARMSAQYLELYGGLIAEMQQELAQHAA